MQEINLIIQKCEHCYHYSEALVSCVRLPYKSFPMFTSDYCSKWLSRAAEEKRKVDYNSPATQINNMQLTIDILTKRLDNFVEDYRRHCDDRVK